MRVTRERGNSNKTIVFGTECIASRRHWHELQVWFESGSIFIVAGSRWIYKLESVIPVWASECISKNLLTIWLKVVNLGFFRSCSSSEQFTTIWLFWIPPAIELSVRHFRREKWDLMLLRCQPQLGFCVFRPSENVDVVHTVEGGILVKLSDEIDLVVQLQVHELARVRSVNCLRCAHY